MRKKLGRNDPCWCGSGKKYKHCHMMREKEPPVQPWEASKLATKAFNKKMCLAPVELHGDCTTQIIKAHTVPKKGSLERIARSGHVYGFVPRIENFQKYGGVLFPELIGIRKASTFTGFCSYHDNKLFAEIEDKEFVGTTKQCFLLGYRALAREFFAKEASHAMNELRRTLDRGKDIDEQIVIQGFVFLFNAGVALGLRDSWHHKKKYDRVLLTDNFSSVRFARISILEPPPVMLSCSFFPEFDFNGNALQDLADVERIPHALNVTSFFGGRFGEIVFSWLSDSDESCIPFVESLLRLPKQDITNALIRLFFETCENVFLSPEWWESLQEFKRQALVIRMAEAVHPGADLGSNRLLDDGIDYDRWHILKIDKNF